MKRELFEEHEGKAIVEATRVAEAALRAVKELDNAAPQDLVEKARVFDIVPADGEEFDAFRARVRSYFPPPGPAR